MANAVGQFLIRKNGSTTDVQTLIYDFVTGLTDIDGQQNQVCAGMIKLGDADYVDVTTTISPTGLEIPSFKLVKVSGTTYGG